MKSSSVQKFPHVFALFGLLSICLSSAACGTKFDPTKVACKDSVHCPEGYQCVRETSKDIGHCQKGSASSDAGSEDAKGGSDGSRGTLSDLGGSAGSGGSVTRDAAVSSADARLGGTTSVPSVDARLGGTTSVPSVDANLGGATSSSLPAGGTSGDSGSSAGGGAISWPDALPPTDAPGSPAGTTCTANTQCSSGHCIDGVCCAAASCTGCFACSNTLTGQPDGTCAPVSNGKIRPQACTDETATKPCGDDGTCDGKGACRKAAAGNSCGTGSCNANAAYLPAPTCDGKGVCAPGTAQSCSPYPCLATGCDKKCGKQSDCDTGTYCDITTSSCKATKTNGTAATQAYECTSGIMADGVCCNKECTGCSACTADLNGQDSKTTGTCLPVTKAKGAAPHNACPIGSDPCGMDGTCDGSGQCNYPTVGSECGSKSCNVTTSMLTKGTCNAEHTCTQTTSSCPGAMACLANGSDCRSAPCTGESDCASGSYCTSTGTCAAKSGAGSLCTPATANQCNGGACIDGHCCSVASCGTCQACTGTAGTCVTITNAEDPDSCSGTMACNAAGACKKKPGQSCELNTECLTGFCADNVCCDRACNGSCEYCNSAGECGYVTGTPKTGHPPCAGDSSVCKGTCKGGKADCDLPGSETVCRQAACQGTSAQINQETCNGTGNCPAQTTSNCGAFLCSGTSCPTSCSGGGECVSGAACVSRTCQICDPGTTACGTTCADTQTNTSHCGRCGNPCQDPTPYCANGTCVACTIPKHCTDLGYAGCSNGSCFCPQKNSNNILLNPGFDGSASSWTLFKGEGSAGPIYNSADDASTCPGSGSVVVPNPMDEIQQCIPVPSGATQFRAGFRHKGAGFFCYISFNKTSDCEDSNSQVGTGKVLAGQASTAWNASPIDGAEIPPEAARIWFRCQNLMGEFTVDELYLNINNGGF